MKTGDRVRILIGDERWINKSGNRMEIKDLRPDLVGEEDVVTKIGKGYILTEKYKGPFSPINLKLS